ncbi:MAG: polyphosphate kinase [Candidatus Xenobia bacterium]|jgi:polyphosphate kinase
MAVDILQKPDRFLNRELSWLAFNERVLALARDSEVPLFERLRFLSISDGNLDEFFMVRFAELVTRYDSGSRSLSPDGLRLPRHLKLLRQEARALFNRQQEAWQELKVALAAQGIRILTARELTRPEKSWLEGYFVSQILPALTPVAVDPAHPFPLIPNDGLCLALRLRDDKGSHWQMMVLPSKLRRFVRLKESERYIRLEHVVPLCIKQVLPNFELESATLFHVLRDQEMEIEATEDGDLLQAFREALKGRKRGSVIRLSLAPSTPDDVRDYLCEELETTRDQIFFSDGMLNLGSVAELIRDDGPPNCYPPFEGRLPDALDEWAGDYFSAIREHELLVHHPYESFSMVVQFVQHAASDPDVVAIKQTLYRTSKDSPIVRALVEAAEAGKAVVAVVELKARFDEEANIRLAERLERAGAQVVYGFANLKTHAKVSLITRREGNQMRTYVHYGTGNYHPDTARAYSDLSLFSCDPALCRDATRLFNYITGYAVPEKFEKLAVSPINLKTTLLEKIAFEAELARLGKPCGIWAKMNALLEPDVIDALYRASRAGVPIELVVRGQCALRPQLEGLSSTIRVKSIVGRFLEHSRIFCFSDGHELPSPKASVYISSADWMHRNLLCRVEALVPVNGELGMKLQEVLLANLRDNTNSWELASDGSYRRLWAHGERFSAQEFFTQREALPVRRKSRAFEDLFSAPG